MSNIILTPDSSDTESRRIRKHTRASSIKNSKKPKNPKEFDPLALYFRQISKFPLLTVQEEQNIGEKIVNIEYASV